MHAVSILPATRLIFFNVIVAAAYFATGRLGLLLAIDSGYATAIWPPSGIALAAVLLAGYRVSPGILIGSLVVNLSVTEGWWQSPAMVSQLWTFTFIGMGAAAQACAGRFLLYRFGGFPNPLSEMQSILRFFLLAGPASCLISSTVGTTALTLMSIVPAQNALESWSTWWVGDTMGAIVFTPLILVWGMTPAKLWHRRRMLVSVLLLGAFSVSTFMFVYARSWEADNLRLRFNDEARILSVSLSQVLKANLDVLHTVSGMLKVSNHIDRDSFKSLTAWPLKDHPSLQSLSWNPYVRDNERAAVEAEMKKAYGPQAEIKERRGGKFVRAARQPDYVTVLFIEPYADNAAAQGFDVASNPIFLAALNKARDFGAPAITSRITIIQDKAKQFGALVFYPYFGGADDDIAIIEERRRKLQGYVTGVFRIGDIMSLFLQQVQNRVFDVQLHDLSAKPADQLLYTTSFADGGSAAGPPPDLQKRPLHWSFQHQVAGRTWELRVAPTLANLDARKTYNAWLVFALGLLVTGVMGMFALFFTGRTLVLEETVQARTVELENANKAKSQFLSSMSHELRTPLNAIMGFTQVMSSETFGDLGSPKYKEYLADIEYSGEHLVAMINDVLDISKIEAGEVQIDEYEINVPKMLKSCIKMVEAQAEAKYLQLEPCESPANLPHLLGDRRYVTQVVLNLLANAVKFTPVGGSVTLGAALDDEGRIALTVKDTGVGISAADLQKVLEPFGQAREHPELTHEGTGLGLSISKGLIDLHGGSLVIDSQVGIGTKITTVFPPERTIPIN